MGVIAGSVESKGKLVEKKVCLLNAVDQVHSPMDTIVAGQQTILGDKLIGELPA